MPSSEPEDWQARLRHALREHDRERSGPDSPLRIGRYEIRSLIGRGGSGEVYRAWDRELAREVALKILLERFLQHEPARARFQREARMVALLAHPHIVIVHDIGEIDGRPFLVLELVEGGSLDRVLSSRVADVRWIATILEKAARGVGAAHQHGIVHRDLKPGNIFLTRDGEPKVGDFGLARATGARTRLTRTDATIGTPLYMAPEQVGGHAMHVSARTDVYALGVILYEALAGSPPHEGDTVGEVYAKILCDPPAPLRTRLPEVPQALEAICLKALEKNPSRRYPDANALAEDLRRYLAGQPVSAKPLTRLHRIRRAIGRRKAVFAIVLSAALAATAVAVLARIGENRAAILRESAEHRARTHLEAGRQTLEQIRVLMRDADFGGQKASDLLQRARDRYREALQAYPDHPEAHLGIGRTYVLEGALDEGMKEFDRAVAVAPGFAAPYLERAWIRLLRYQAERHLPSGAVAHETEESARLRALIEEDLRKVETCARADEQRFFGSALLAFADGKYDEAERGIARYLDVAPAEPVAHYWRAHALRHLKRLPEAEGAYSQAIALWTRFPWAYKERAVVRKALGNAAGAIADLSEVLREDPNDAGARERRALYRLETGDLDGAIEDGNVLLRLQLPRPDIHYYNRGLAHHQKGDRQAATADYDEAIRLNPSKVEAYVNRGALRLNGGDRDTGMADFDTAIRLDPRHPIALLNRGLARQALGNLEGAAQDLAQAIAVAPEDWPDRANAEQSLREIRDRLPAAGGR